MRLSQNFSLEELIASETAARRGIDNHPPPDVLINLRRLARGLEDIRLLFGAPIHINSGYRCEALNTAVGGASDSMHRYGLAADIVCPQFGTPLEACKAILAAGIQTDELIHEFASWAHVAFATAGKLPRHKVLTITSASGGYRQGLA